MLLLFASFTSGYKCAGGQETQVYDGGGPTLGRVLEII